MVPLPLNPSWALDGPVAGAKCPLGRTCLRCGSSPGFARESGVYSGCMIVDSSTDQQGINSKGNITHT